MKTNKLSHVISRNDLIVNVLIKIQLADDCKNGHQDFSITATFWEVGKVRTDRNMVCGGCCHEEILKYYPELKQFVDLHLCDFNGVPMHATANGFYHLTKGFERLNGKTQKEYFCDYYRITPNQYDILSTAKDQEYFGFLLVELGILTQWGKEANEAIKQLELLTGNEFLNDSVRNNFSLSDEKLAEIKKLQSEGYYTPSKILERENQKNADLKAKKLKDLKDKFEAKNLEALIEYELNKIGIELFLTFDNIIFYKHKNEVVFNWQNSSYTKKWNITEFTQFIHVAKENEIFKDTNFILN